ncbi:putative Protein disulfide-isomerase [Blattamonas nauphoetae]|uniref:protein disulfide-isomerase n=1 Tax=Blattamonas nauphoetae TaxID=2049346 RepID=A0ABQ9YM26_9EUKA|nr:putative Protein disulfide-isomerase [Blattamonas nauphoetae]
MILVILCFTRLISSYDRVVKLIPETFLESSERGNLLVKFYSTTCHHCRLLAPTYQALANVFQNPQYNVTIAEINCGEYEAFCEDQNIDGYPIVRWYSNATTYKEFNKRRTLENFQTFVGEHIGRIYRPEFTNIVEVADDNFEAIVLNPEKNVLLAFTAPWCSHCHKMRPDYESLAGVYFPKDDIVIAEINGDIFSKLTDEYNVIGFPTILFFPAIVNGDEERMRMLNNTMKKEEELLKNITASLPSKNQKQETTEDQEIVEKDTPPRYKGYRIVKSYEGKREFDAMLSFTNEHTGIFREIDREIKKTAGLLDGVDEIVRRFLGSYIRRKRAEELGEQEIVRLKVEEKDEEEDDGITVTEGDTEEEEGEFDGIPALEEMEAELLDFVNVVSYPSNVYQTYRRYITALKEKGIDFLISEQKRLGRVIESNSVAQHLQPTLVIRFNVLKLFVTLYKQITRE